MMKITEQQLVKNSKFIIEQKITDHSYRKNEINRDISCVMQDKA